MFTGILFKTTGYHFKRLMTINIPTFNIYLLSKLWDHLIDFSINFQSVYWDWIFKKHNLFFYFWYSSSSYTWTFITEKCFGIFTFIIKKIYLCKKFSYIVLDTWFIIWDIILRYKQFYLISILVTYSFINKKEVILLRFI